MKYAASSVLAMNMPHIVQAATEENKSSEVKVRFLGTGAADWNGKRANGEYRRFSSILINDHILIDLTSKSLDMLEGKKQPDVIFYTHSHFDHYHPESALKVGIKQVYVSNTWFDIAKADFREAAKKLGLPMPEITPVFLGQPVKVDNLNFMPLPANHITEKRFEPTQIYRVSNEKVRLLYATDTGGLMTQALELADLMHKPLTGLIMEATMGVKHHLDYRIFSHSSVEDVSRTVKVLISTKQYIPRAGQPVYVTHMAKGLHESQSEQEALFPRPLTPAFDGLEVVFK